MLPGVPEFSELLKAGLESARKAVDLDPADGRNHIDLAWSYMLLGQPTRGEKHFSLALKDRIPAKRASWRRAVWASPT